MNSENSIMNAGCDITGSIVNKSVQPLLNDITREKVSGIYKIVNKVNGKYYVGSSYDIGKRVIRHKRQLKLRNHFNNYLQKSYDKHGEDNFEFVVVECVLPISSELFKVEQKYLDIAKTELKKTYNLRFNACGEPCGNKRNDIIKERLRIGALTRKPLLIKRAPITELTRRRLRLSHIGQKASDETKRKISLSRIGKLNPNYGKHPSDATIQKHSLSVNKSVLQVDENHNVLQEFQSIKEAGIRLHIHPSEISRVCNGMRLHSHNLYFKFKK